MGDYNSLSCGGCVSRILVINHKGGCGKTTVATNLAAAFARRGQTAALLDYDPQGSSARWASLRDTQLPRIQCISAHEVPVGVTRSWFMRVEPFTDVCLVDTPAGVRRELLMDHVRQADAIVVPVLPSAIDIHAAARFVQELLLTAKVRSLGKPVGIVANRVRQNTIAYRALQRFLVQVKIPVVGVLRDTQNYVRTAAVGKGVADLPLDANTRRDVAQLNRVMRWIDAALTSGQPSVEQVS